MKTIQEWYDEYGESHQNPTNKLVHWICIPLIFFSIVGLFWSIPSDFIAGFFPQSIRPFGNYATLMLALTLIFYIRLSIPIFFGMLIVSVLSLLGNYYLMGLNIAPLWQISIAIFVVAWIGQFIGHNIEGKKPSFFKDLQFLLIGPAWLMGFIYKKLGINY